MAYENRFAQYDIAAQRPTPLVPRYLRWPVTERMSADGQVITALDHDSVNSLIPKLRDHGIEAVAIGLLHSYANPAHEEQIAQRLQEAFPDLWITTSATVCPEIREYERLSTACANAYVQPLMARYLTALDGALRADGFGGSLLLMMSSGGLTTLETGAAFPIRLLDSGPAGGAILAGQLAKQCALDEVLSFDMGGTTAKICLIDNGEPQTARLFEVARAHRHTKGSGLPVRIPIVEMVEIGAGGGSIARIDALQRVTVGPDSAGASPGPACYDQGGEQPTVTDADLLLGRLAPEGFAGNRIALVPEKSDQVVRDTVCKGLNLDLPLAAFAISEVVDEDMANAARVHAIERGKDIARRAMIAFGGAAPLHAARLAEKLDIDQVVIPAGAGVGSAIGFLRAPLSFQVVRTRYTRLDAYNHQHIEALFVDMRAEAGSVLSPVASAASLSETRSADMRYIGQGHEITVPLDGEDLQDGMALQKTFENAYRAQYGRTIPNLAVEVMTWTLTLRAPSPSLAPVRDGAQNTTPQPIGTRALFDPGTSAFVTADVYARDVLKTGDRLTGPAAIVEDQTTIIVPGNFEAGMISNGAIVLDRLKPN